jgi:two-component system, chemotaxis family, chemotaxis protein CheV
MLLAGTNKKKLRDYPLKAALVPAHGFEEFGTRWCSTRPNTLKPLDAEPPKVSRRSAVNPTQMFHSPTACSGEHEDAMSDLLRQVDGRTKLAGNNKLEMLLFSLGTDRASGRKESYGINVFKVREVMRTPDITRAPDMPPSVQGMVSLRGQLVPVVDLARYAGIDIDGAPEIMIVTEYNGYTQGFLVESVDTILRIDWATMKVPPDMLAKQTGGFVTAVTELASGKLVMMLDVERVLSESSRYDDELLFRNLQPLDVGERTVLFADDSSVARKQIVRTLDALNLRHVATINGSEAWRELERIASYAASKQQRASEFVHLVLTDVEMPEMDGFILTKRIKSDPRFSDIPVVMHSSLSGTQNQQLGYSVGVDDYVSKFEPQRLAEVLGRRLAH